MSWHLINILDKKNIKIDKSRLMMLAKIYKNSPTQSNFKKIAGII